MNRNFLWQNEHVVIFAYSSVFSAAYNSKKLFNGLCSVECFLVVWSSWCGWLEGFKVLIGGREDFSLGFGNTAVSEEPGLAVFKLLEC